MPESYWVKIQDAHLDVLFEGGVEAETSEEAMRQCVCNALADDDIKAFNGVGLVADYDDRSDEREFSWSASDWPDDDVEEVSESDPPSADIGPMVRVGLPRITLKEIDRRES